MSPAPTATIKLDSWWSHPERHGAMFDLAASEDVKLREGECKVIPLGIRMKLPDGYFGLVVPRSSTCLKYGIMMANSVGVIEPDSIVRPFFPGGDYERFEYPDGCTVLDNPPFSILAQIIDFYLERGVRFLLFAPFLTLFGCGNRDVTFIPANCQVTYDNGAVVNTGFITNLDADNRIVSSKALRDAVRDADGAQRRADVFQRPHFELPANAVNAARFRHGSDIRIPKDQCSFTRALDSQKEQGKALFGGASS